MIRLLVDKGADINARDDRGRTPLDFAYGRDQSRCFRCLVSFDPALDRCKYKGPLFVAAAELARGRNASDVLAQYQQKTRSKKPKAHTIWGRAIWLGLPLSTIGLLLTGDSFILRSDRRCWLTYLQSQPLNRDGTSAVNTFLSKIYKLGRNDLPGGEYDDKIVVALLGAGIEIRWLSQVRSPCKRCS